MQALSRVLQTRPGPQEQILQEEEQIRLNDLTEIPVGPARSPRGGVFVV